MSEPQPDHPTVEADLQAFIDVIRSSETYKQFVAATEQLESDAEAQELLNTYHQKQQQLQEDEFEQSVMSDLREIQSEIEDNQTIQAHRDAEEALVSLLQQTNDAITEQIGQEFARSIGGGCC